MPRSHEGNKLGQSKSSPPYFITSYVNKIRYTKEFLGHKAEVLELFTVRDGPLEYYNCNHNIGIANSIIYIISIEACLNCKICNLILTIITV